MSEGCLEGVWKVSGPKFILGPNIFWGGQFFCFNTYNPNQIGPELGTAQPQLVLIILSFGLVRSRRESKGAIGCQVLLLFTEGLLRNPI